MASPSRVVTGRCGSRVGSSVRAERRNPRVQDITDPTGVRVQIGIDAAAVADHHVTIRGTTSDGQVQLSRFHVPLTIAGLTRLGHRLAAYPQVMAVAEPTSMTWLGLQVAMQDAGCDLALVGTRHAARLCGAISGKHKSDVIDADVLVMAGGLFDLAPLHPADTLPAGPATVGGPSRQAGHRRQPCPSTADLVGAVGVP